LKYSKDFLHHLDEFLEGNVTIVVLIDLSDNGVNSCAGELVVSTETENFLNLILGDGTGAVLIEHLEGSLELVVGSELLFVHGSNDELGVVNETRIVSVDLLEHLVNFFVRHNSTVMFNVTFGNFVLGKLSVTVLIESLEDASEVVFLGFGQKLGGNEGVGGLLQGLVGSEVLEVVKGTDKQQFNSSNLKQFKTFFV